MPRRPRIHLANHPQQLVRRVYKPAPNSKFKAESRVRLHASEG
jgi:hypothetical protein